MGCLSGRWTWRAAAIGWLATANASADAETRQYVELRYEIDPSLDDCPNVFEFRAMVAQKLGYDPYRPGATLAADVRVVPAETGLQGTIGWKTSEQEEVRERRFASRSGDCHEIATTMAFVVAVQVQLVGTDSMVDAGVQSGDPIPAARAEPRTGEASKADGQGPGGGVRLSLASFALKPPPNPPASWRSVMIGGGPSVGFGLGPEPVVLGRLFLAVEHGPAAFEVAASASLPTSTHQSSGGGFQYRLMLASIAVCGRYHSVLPCGLVNLGSVQARGFGVDHPASPRGVVAQVGPRLGYGLDWGKYLTLFGHCEGLYSLTRWTVDLDGMHAWTTPRVSAVVGLDLAGRFP